MTPFNLAFLSLRPKFWLTGSAWLWARSRDYEFAASSAVAVFPACSLAAGIMQRVSAWIWRAFFSVIKAGQSLLVAVYVPLQFRHFRESSFGQLSCLWPVREHNAQTSAVAWQVHAPWPNCWHLKQCLGRVVGLVGLDLFNNDTCPSGHISRPTQVNVSEELLSFSKKPSYTGKCASGLLSFSKQLLRSDHIVHVWGYLKLINHIISDKRIQLLTGIPLCKLVGLDLFNDDTCPSGHISRPTQVNVSEELLSFSKKPSYTGKCASGLLSFSKQLLRSDHIVHVWGLFEVNKSHHIR